MLKNSLAVEEKTIDRSLIEQWVHRWGGSASEAVLESGCQFFHVPIIEGVIGYRAVYGYAITFGDPICSNQDIPHLAKAFQSYCQEQNLEIVYIIASEKFAKWAIQNLCSVMIEVGEELIFDPQHNPKQGSRGNKLRNYVNHAQHLGLKIHEYISHDATLEHAMKKVGEDWLRARRGPQIHLGDLIFFDDRADKRWFYVNDGKSIIAMALLSRLKASQGWLIKFLLHTPNAPRGTSELLVTSIMDILREEGCHYLTFGMVPADRLGEIKGLNQFSIWVAQLAYKMTKWIFKLDRRKLFWQKFHPKIERSYVLMNKSSVGLKEIKAIMKALKINL